MPRTTTLVRSRDGQGTTRAAGRRPDHPTGIVEVFAPVSGTITDQQITDQSGVQAYTPPNPFTISDLSHVWIICDVWENNMAQVHIGEYADIHLVAYPDRVLKGADQQHSAHHRPQHSHREGPAGSGESRPDADRDVRHRDVPRRRPWKSARQCRPRAILHLHDREWVYTPLGNGRFRRVEVAAGNMLPDNMQEVVSGHQAGRSGGIERACFPEHGGAVNDSQAG